MPLNPPFFWSLALVSPSSQGGSSSWDPNTPPHTHICLDLVPFPHQLGLRLQVQNSPHPATDLR